MPDEFGMDADITMTMNGQKLMGYGNHFISSLPDPELLINSCLQELFVSGNQLSLHMPKDKLQRLLSLPFCVLETVAGRTKVCLRL